MADFQTTSSITVSSGHVSSGVTVSSGMIEYVLSGGRAFATTVDGGGTQVVSAGGLADNTVVLSGGVLDDYGSARAAQIDAHAFMVVSGGGVATLAQDDGLITVEGLGVAVSASVAQHGTLDVTAGGQANFTTVSSGGVMTVSTGAMATATSIDFNGEVVVDGGTLVGAGLDAGGILQLAAGSVSGVNVFGAAALGGMNGIAQSFNAAVEAGGIVFVGSGAIDHAAQIFSGGTEVVDIGGVTTNLVVQSGGVQTVFGALSAGQTGGVSSNTIVQSGGIVVEEGSTQYNTITNDLVDVNIAAGGTIDLTTIGFSAADTASLDRATGLLTVSAGGTTTEIQLLGMYEGDYAHLSAGAYGGTDVTVSTVPCYCRGTRIRTELGEVAVEDLRIGDRLIVRSGEARPLRWIGRRSYDGRFASGNADVLPVTFRAGALDGVAPVRDLSVSPLHAMFIDGVLIPAVALVNGQSVTQAEAVETVEYFHLELDGHDVVEAEGAWAETYVDDGNRAIFHNAAEYAERYPGAERVAAVYCAPRVEDGPVLATVRRRMAELVAAEPVRACRGYLDRVERGLVVGWAIDDADPARRVRVRVRDNGVAIGEVEASLARADLLDAGIGDGCYGFELRVPGGFSPFAAHAISAEIEDGTKLHGTLLLAEAPVCPPASEGAEWVRGHVDLIGRDRVLGWAVDDRAMAVAVAVQVVVDGVLAASVLANRYRRDVADAGLGSGRHAFEHHFTPPLSALDRHVIELRCERTGAALGGAVIEPAMSFGPDLEQAVDAAVTALAGEADAGRVLNFLEAQMAKLRQSRADANSGRAARDRAAHRRLAKPRKRALVIDNEWPDPARDAGSVAILSHIRGLTALGYDVSLVAARQMERTPPAWLAGEAIFACAAPFYGSVEEVLRRQEGGFDLVYLHRVANAARYLMLARDHQPGARVLYSVADLHHVRLARQAAAEDRPELLPESHRLRLAECNAAWQADAVLTHSAVEAAELRRLVPSANIHVVPWETPIHPLPGGATRSGVGLIGNFAHAPNVDAARHLVRSIMPLVWAAAPEMVCRIAGAAMGDAVRGLAGDRVEILGQVPSLETLFEQVRVTVAPLRYGAGIKGKVLDSLAAGVPCVASPIAAEGLDLPPALVADGDAAMAEAIVRLHRDQAAHAAAVAAGLALVGSGWTAELVVCGLAAALGARDGIGAAAG